MTTIDAGYRAAREAIGLAQLRLGRVKMTGADCLDLLHRLSTQDLAKLSPGHVAGTVLTSDKGRIVDLVTVVAMPDQLLLLTSPDNQQQVVQWLDKYTITEDSQLIDVTAESGLLAVFGPNWGRLA